MTNKSSSSPKVAQFPGGPNNESPETALFYYAPAALMCVECGSINVGAPVSSGALGQVQVTCPNSYCSMFQKLFVVEVMTVTGIFAGMVSLQPSRVANPINPTQKSPQVSNGLIIRDPKIMRDPKGGV